MDKDRELTSEEKDKGCFTIVGGLVLMILLYAYLTNEPRDFSATGDAQVDLCMKNSRYANLSEDTIRAMCVREKYAPSSSDCTIEWDGRANAEICN